MPCAGDVLMDTDRAPSVPPMGTVAEWPVVVDVVVSAVFLGAAVLAVGGALDTAAELVGHHLHAVADPQHRDPQLEQLRRGAGRPLFIDALRAAREDQPQGPAAADLLHGEVERMDLAIDPALAHPAGDELGELAAEVEDQDSLVGGG